MKNNTVVYTLNQKAYINLTNRCSNRCDFCIRNGRETFYDYYLWLDKEPSASEVIKQLEPFLSYDEFVFCGFGEPLFRFDVILEVAEYLKSKGKKTRLNTNGQADLILPQRDAAKEIKGLIDIVSISLNASDAEKYQSICHCSFGVEGFYSMLRFAQSCKNQGIKTVLSVVDYIGQEEIEKAKKIARKLGVELRIRKYAK